MSLSSIWDGDGDGDGHCVFSEVIWWFSSSFSVRRIEISSFWSRSSERVLVICVGAFVGTDLRVLWEWVGEEAFWRWSDERLGECVCVAWERLVMSWVFCLVFG